MANGKDWAKVAHQRSFRLPEMTYVMAALSIIWEKQWGRAALAWWWWWLSEHSSWNHCSVMLPSVATQKHLLMATTGHLLCRSDLLCLTGSRVPYPSFSWASIPNEKLRRHSSADLKTTNNIQTIPPPLSIQSSLHTQWSLLHSVGDVPYSATQTFIPLRSVSLVIRWEVAVYMHSQLQWGK